jgi:hypothetical protein
VVKSVADDLREEIEKVKAIIGSNRNKLRPPAESKWSSGYIGSRLLGVSIEAQLEEIETRLNEQENTLALILKHLGVERDYKPAAAAKWTLRRRRAKQRKR